MQLERIYILSAIIFQTTTSAGITKMDVTPSALLVLTLMVLTIVNVRKDINRITVIHINAKVCRL